MPTIDDNAYSLEAAHPLRVNPDSRRSEMFLVSDESELADELNVSIQELIQEEGRPPSVRPLYVDRLLQRTTAPHGLTRPEIERIFGAAHSMASKRRHMWFATLGDGLQDMDAGEARRVVDTFLKTLVVEQRKAGLPQDWLLVWETIGGLHTHIIFIGNRRIVDIVQRSARFGNHLRVRWVYDLPGLPTYLSKERTPQTEYAIGTTIRGGRKPGSHQLPGGGDRVRLSEALERDAIAAGHVGPWQKTNAKRSTERKTAKPYRIRQGKAPTPAGQILLFPELGRQPARLRDFHGGFMSPAQSRETEFHRERSGLSQHKLAQLAGLSQPHYANVVRGHDAMSRSAARQLREVLLHDLAEAA